MACSGTKPKLTFTQPLSQPAPDLVNGIKVRHMENVGILWLGCDLLQLLLERFPDAHSEHPDSSFGSCLRGLQNIILASAICEKDGHPLNASGYGPRSIALREDVGGGVADSVPCHSIPPQVAYVPSCPLHVLQGSVSTQVKLDGGPVTISDNCHSCFIRRHVKRLYQVGYPLPNLFKVLLSHAGGCIQDERQVVVNIFTTWERRENQKKDSQFEK